LVMRICFYRLYISRSVGCADTITGLSTTCLWGNRIVITEHREPRGAQSQGYAKLVKRGWTECGPGKS